MNVVRGICYLLLVLLLGCEPAPETGEPESPPPNTLVPSDDVLAARVGEATARNFMVHALARLGRLDEAVEVGEYVPERFYRAIAEILAYVYELSGRRIDQEESSAVGVPA